MRRVTNHQHSNMFISRVALPRPCFFILCSLFFVVCACSESDGEDTAEYSNWKERNEMFFATLEDSLSHGEGQWKKIKTYTKDPAAEGVATDYVYVKVLERGINGGSSPNYTDGIQIAYRGRLISSISYPQGYVFDETYIGDYNPKTAAYYIGSPELLVAGFATAVMHMTRGDRWLVYVPYQLGYNTKTDNGIPAYSTLIFDVALIDYE